MQREKEIIIVGDVIKSRREFDPYKWNNFHKSIEAINRLFKESLLIPITIYSGDSFGGICKNISSAVKIVLAIQRAQQFQKSRMVIIEGEITYGLEGKSFLALEGPALWESVNILDEIQKKGQLFSISIENKDLEISIDIVLNLILSIRDNWKEREWDIYKRHKINYDQRKIGRAINVSQQYVSKVLKQSDINLIIESENKLKKIINNNTYGMYQY